MADSISTRSLELLHDKLVNCPFCGQKVFLFKEMEENELHDLSPCAHVVFYYMEIAEINLFDHVNPEFAKRYLKKLKDNWKSVTGEEECDLEPEIEEAFLSGSTEECCAESEIFYCNELISPDLFPGAKEVHIIKMDDSAQGSRPCGGMDPPWYAIGFVKKYDA
jgi:hypothetical protein